MKIRTMCWKELRENAKWGLIGLVLISIALAYGWSAAQSPFQNGNGEAYQSLCHPTLLMITLFGFPVIGTALGFLQIIPEQSRDRWAFLVHRPIHLWALCLGKISAGLLIYILAAGVPFFFLSFWASRPGSVAGPFYWGQALPGIFHFFLGICFYFLALLCAVREARWFGSKLVPLLSGFGIAVLLTVQADAGPALFYALLAMLISGSAALVAFQQSAGTVGRTPWQRAPLTILLTAGYSLLLLFAAALLSLLTRTDSINSYTSVYVLKDGEVVLLKQEREKRTVTKADGTPYPMSPREMEKFYTRRLESNRLSYKTKNGFASFYGETYRDADHWFVPEASSEQGRWFFLPDRNYFVRYSTVRRTINGYFGTKGFTENPPIEAEHFPGIYHNRDRNSRRLVYLFEQDVYWIDLVNQQIFHLKHVDTPSDLKGVTSVYSSNNESVDTYLAAIQTTPGRTFSVYRADGTLLFSTILEEDPELYPDVQLLKSEDNSRFYFLLQPRWDQPAGSSALVISTDARAQQLGRREIPGEKQQIASKSWQRFLIYPPLSLGTWGPSMAYVGYKARQGDPSYEWQWKRTVRDKGLLIESFIVFSLLGLFSATAALKKMKQYQFSLRSRCGWLVLLFLFGLPGLLAFWTVHTWAAMIACPSCRKSKRVDLASCSHCGAHAPEASADGTEVFGSPPHAATEP